VIVAVFNTNVLAAGFVGLADPHSTPGELPRRWRAKTFTLVVSEPILVKLARVFSYPYFTRRLSTGEIADVFVGLRAQALIQPITVEASGVATHPQDDVILATAVSAQAPYLVTGDKPLLERRAFRGTLLLSPRQFLEILAADAGNGGSASGPMGPRPAGRASGSGMTSNTEVSTTQ
jgi:putative PIN family toxin of toxin-antitoxin system